MKYLVFLFFCLISSYVFTQDSKLTAKDVMQKVDNTLSGNSTTYAEMKITTVRPKWTRSKAMKTWSDGKDGMILVTEPVKEKGIVFLKKGNEVWNWTPSINRMIKMPPSMMMQSWLGTDLKTDDLVRSSSIVNDYSHKFLNDTTIDGRLCYQVVLIPNEDAPVVWGKMVTCVDKEHFVQMNTKLYDEDLELVSTMKASMITNYQGRYLAKKMEVIPEGKNAQKTIMEYQKVEFDINIPEGFFTVQMIKKVE